MVSVLSFSNLTLPRRSFSTTAWNPRAMAKELYFNHDGSATKKLQVAFLNRALPLPLLLLLQSSLSNNGLLCWMQAGVDMVAELVGVTLGPKGRNVVLQNKYGPPKIVNDGETVLKEVM